MSVFVLDTRPQPAIVVAQFEDDDENAVEEAIALATKYIRTHGVDIAPHVHIVMHEHEATTYAQGELRAELDQAQRAAEAADREAKRQDLLRLKSEAEAAVKAYDEAAKAAAERRALALVPDTTPQG